MDGIKGVPTTDDLNKHPEHLIKTDPIVGVVSGEVVVKKVTKKDSKK